MIGSVEQVTRDAVFRTQCKEAETVQHDVMRNPRCSPVAIGRIFFMARLYDSSNALVLV